MCHQRLGTARGAPPRSGQLGALPLLWNSTVCISTFGLESFDGTNLEIKAVRYSERVVMDEVIDMFFFYYFAFRHKSVC